VPSADDRAGGRLTAQGATNLARPTCSAVSAGAAMPRCPEAHLTARPSTKAATCRSSSRSARVHGMRLACPGRLKLRAKRDDQSTDTCRTRSIIRSSNWRDVESIQCTSSNTATTGCRRVRTANCRNRTSKSFLACAEYWGSAPRRNLTATAIRGPRGSAI
jgi:hypothetical protein